MNFGYVTVNGVNSNTQGTVTIAQFDILQYDFSLSYLINAKNYSEADKYLESVLSPKATPSHTFEKTDSPAANFATNPPQNLLLSIPLLFISTFLFQLIYFLSTLYPQETSLEFFILGVLLVFICIIFYQTLNEQLKKSRSLLSSPCSKNSIRWSRSRWSIFISAQKKPMHCREKRSLP